MPIRAIFILPVSPHAFLSCASSLTMTLTRFMDQVLRTIVTSPSEVYVDACIMSMALKWRGMMLKSVVRFRIKSMGILTMSMRMPSALDAIRACLHRSWTIRAARLHLDVRTRLVATETTVQPVLGKLRNVASVARIPTRALVNMCLVLRRAACKQSSCDTLSPTVVPTGTVSPVEPSY
jgi:hypothetical protein